MSKLSGIILLLALGAALGRMSGGAPPASAEGAAAGAAKCTSRNGDVNADGIVDLSDAVTILGNLFLGSPAELAPLCDAIPAVVRLPDTGQTKCYGYVENVGWQEAPCDQASCQGQDGQDATGCPSEGRFTDNGDGTVTDHCTGLMWQQTTAWSGIWRQALEYCETLGFAGHDDWRLPNVRELQSIVDYGQFGPAIDPVFGAAIDPELGAAYWTSTTFADFLSHRWIIDFRDGTVHHFGFEGGDGGFNVRAVRNGN